MLVRYIDQEIEMKIELDNFDWDLFDFEKYDDDMAMGYYCGDYVEIEKDVYDFLNAPENNKEPHEMGDTHTNKHHNGLSYDKDKGLTNFHKNLPEMDPWTGDRNPLLDREGVRKEELGKFGKSSSHAARNEEITFTPEDATDMILTFLTDELPITSRYIDHGLVREWITKTYNL